MFESISNPFGMDWGFNNTYTNTYDSIEEHEEVEQEREFKLKTTQRNVVVPTNELIRQKNTDFRVLLSISAISNVDNNTISGENCRYCSLEKLDRNIDKLCKAIDISVSQFRKHLRALLKHNTDEFKLVEKEYNDKKVKCLEINYLRGGFVIIPLEKVDRLLWDGSNNCIKLYCNLLWLCVKDGDFVERELTQDYLAELMGLSSSTVKVVKIATTWLEESGLIKTRKAWETKTIVKNGELHSSKPISKIYYSIVV